MPDLRRVILGRRLASDESHHTKLSNTVGLAVFSSDALSSVAYATQEIMASLSMSIHGGHAAAGVAIGMASHWIFGLSVPVALGIVALLIILGISYRQTILAYPTGGGAYIVAKENLGETAALVAGASLLTDYILTVAVSVSAGVQAITSAAPQLAGHNVALTLAAIVVVAIANLRGVKESGAVFAVPTYGFVTLMLLTLVVGFYKWIFGPAAEIKPEQVHAAVQNAEHLTGFALVWVFMRAYSAGCTALTGVEAISNGVPAFRDPAERNASQTMIWMILLLGSMFLGITLLANHFDVVYMHNPDPTAVSEALLSKLAKVIYGDTTHGVARLMYLMLQGFTFAILVIAANTAYADFPRLGALMGRDSYLPRQFASQGDRLVFSNGIMILTVVACLLVWVLNGNPDRLLPLYAMGVFLGFTISQVGMVMHWANLREQERHWRSKAIVNGIGATASAIVMADIAVTKFTHGAWIVVVIVPVMVFCFLNVHRHYIGLQAKLAASRLDAVLPSKNHAIVLVSSLHKGVVQALRYARLISGDRVEALTVDLGSDGFNESPAMLKMRADWTHYGMGIPLRSVSSPYRRIVEPIMDEIERFQQVEPDVCLTVILPEYVPSKWWQRFLHNQMALRIKARLMMKRGIIVTTVRMHVED